MWETLRFVSSSKFACYWLVIVWLCDLLLTALIIKKVPFTNIDWEAYMAEVEPVLRGEFNYSKLEGPTGPIAYPGGFCFFFGMLRWLNLGVTGCQVVFGAMYLAMLAVVFEIYRRAQAPGWLFVLCIVSKRVHSIFVLRLFNDGVAQFLLYLSVLFLLQRRHTLSSMVFSLALGIKMQPIFYIPPVSLYLILFGGWSYFLKHGVTIFLVQVALAAPFLLTNPVGYLSRAFGGPGDLQHVWSVNWRMMPETVFLDKHFAIGLFGCHLFLSLWFSHYRWIPGGWLDKRIWQWSAHTHIDDSTIVGILFSCNFVAIVCLRTMHFQFLVWYFHTVPFLAWYAIQPDRCKGFSWALRSVSVAFLVICIEIPFFFTTSGVVRGPDGRSWETIGVPTRWGSVLLFTTHLILLILLARRHRGIRPDTHED